MPYALTATGYRTIRTIADLHVGETYAEEVPQALIDVMAAAETSQRTNLANLVGQADAALDGLRAYRDNASPSNAQTVTAVKLLCRVCIALIRIVLRRVDATS